MEIPKETLRNAAELGFIACRWPAMRDFALGIFSAVRLTAPDNPAWIIGTAMVYANCDDSPDTACKFMAGEGISVESGDLMARAFLGLFLRISKHPDEAEKVMKAVVADGSDAEASRLAQAALGSQG
jgi:hypothetical protein